MTTDCMKLMIIRHAEKPNKHGGIAGVTEAGLPDRDELTVRGWQRAGALVRFFNPFEANLRAGLAVPGAVFAAKPSDNNPSKRPLHTVTPLAADLKVPIRTDFAVHQENELVRAVLQAAAAVLICWHHERIARIAAEFGIAIEEWQDGVFDRVLVFDRAGDGWRLNVVQQHLLPGDS